MAKNWNIAIVVIILAVAIFILPKTTTFNAVGTSKTSCESTRQNWLDEGRLCAMPCFLMTTEIADCISQYYSDPYYYSHLEWWSFTSSVEDAGLTCNEYYSNRILTNAGSGRYQGLYNCAPVFRAEVGDISCNTAADIDCNGAVSRDELGTYITKWTNNEITRDDLGFAISAWAS